MRLFTLVLALLGTLWAIDQAAKPETWYWLWKGQPPTRRSRDMGKIENGNTAIPAAGNRHDLGENSDSKSPLSSQGHSSIGGEGFPLISVEKLAKNDQFLSRIASKVTVHTPFWEKTWDKLSPQEREVLQVVVVALRRQQNLSQEVRVGISPLVQSLDREAQDYFQNRLIELTQNSSTRRRGSKEGTDEKKREEEFIRLTDLKTDWENRYYPLLVSLNETRKRTIPYTDDEAEAIFELQWIIDQLALEQVRDYSVWEFADRQQLFRHLEIYNNYSPSIGEAEPVHYLQLTEQPEVYRGKLISMRGHLRSGYYKISRNNRHGVPGYYFLGFQPEGSREQIFLYSAKIPDGFPELPISQTGEEYATISERVTVVGTFLKLWGYLSEEGLSKEGGEERVDPVLILAEPMWHPEAKTGADRPMTIFGLWSIVGLALLIGFVLTFYFWNHFQKIHGNRSLVQFSSVGLSKKGEAHKESHEEAPDFSEAILFEEKKSWSASQLAPTVEEQLEELEEKEEGNEEGKT